MDDFNIDDLKEEEKEPAQVPFFIHENALMHKDADNQRMKEVVDKMHNIVRWVCITFAIITIVFVTCYTIRTRTWLDTILKMQQQSPVTEVADGVQQQPNP